MIPSTFRKPGLLTTQFSPVATYQLNGISDVTDQSGNGRTLTATTAFPAAAGIRAGKGAIAGGGVHTRTDAGLRLQGDLTVFGVLSFGYPSLIQTIACCGITGTTSGTNQCFSLRTSGGALTLFSEHGAGADDLVSVGEVLTGEWCTVAATRASNVVELYLNGVRLGSATVAAPDGGGSSVFAIGAESSGANPLLGVTILDQVGIWSTALSAAQLVYLTRLTLGFAV